MNNKKHMIATLSLPTVVLLVGAVFTVLVPAFFSLANIMTILAAATVSAIAGLGCTCVCAAGEMDFSVGAAYTMGGISMALLLGKGGMNSYLLALVVTLLLCICYGLINAFLHVRVGLPSFVATYAMYALTYGLMKNITDSTPIYNHSKWPECFTFIGQTYLFGWLPFQIILLFVISILVYVFISKMRSGKYMFMVGANATAAKYVGINVNRMKVIAFVLSSTLAGFAGVVYTSMINGASAFTGEPMLMTALTVLMLGSVMKSGVYNVPGTILAAILLAMISNGMTMMNSPDWVDDVIQGSVLLLAICSMSLVRIFEAERIEREAMVVQEQLAEDN